MEQVTITITTSTDKMRSQPAEQIAQALHSVAHRVLVHGWPPEGHGGMVVTPIYDTKGERCGEMIVAPVPASRA